MTSPPTPPSPAGPASLVLPPMFATSDGAGTQPSPRQRLLAAAFVAALAAGLTFVGQQPPGIRTDFDILVVAGHAWTSGADPYAAAHAFAAQPRGYPLIYPAWAIISTVPVTVWPRPTALGLWMGLSFGALTFAITRRTWWGLAALATPFALHAFFLAQWSPILTASGVLPWLEFTWAAKPSIGAVLFAAFPSRRAAIIGVAATLLSFLVFPGWLSDWRAEVATMHHFVPLVVRPGGWLLLLAWLRWREPEGRLLGALAIVPHTLMPYDFLILALLLRTRTEWLIGAALAWCGYLAMRVWGWIPPSQDFDVSVAAAWPFWLWLCYVPALCLVLLRRRPQPGH